MKEKKDIPEERPKKPSDAKKSLDDIMKRIEPFPPEENQVLHKRYSERKSGGSASARPGDKQGRFGEKGVRRYGGPDVQRISRGTE